MSASRGSASGVSIQWGYASNGGLPLAGGLRPQDGVFPTPLELEKQAVCIPLEC